MYAKLQGHGHKYNNDDTHGKFLSLGILIWNIKGKDSLFKSNKQN